MPTEKLKVESGVPIPAGSGSRGGAPTAFTIALGEMKVGQSFFYEGDSSKVSNRAVMWARYHRNGRKFAVRKENSGARVWRIK